MTFWRTLYSATALLAILTPLLSVAEEAHPGQDLYQRCAACHLPDGAGVPGAFPPLRENVVSLSSTEQGRAYLTYVVLKGVSGEIAVGDQTYRGMMPMVAAGLTDQEISNLLNYLLSEVAPAAANNGAGAEKPARELAPFSPEEIKEQRDAVVDAHTQQSILSVRAEAFSDAASPVGSKEGQQ